MTMIHHIVIKYFTTVKLKAKGSELASMRLFFWSNHILEKNLITPIKNEISLMYY